MLVSVKFSTVPGGYVFEAGKVYRLRKHDAEKHIAAGVAVAVSERATVAEPEASEGTAGGSAPRKRGRPRKLEE